MTASLTHAPGAPIERTEHPHIVKSAGTLGGEPRVEGTRISVGQIFGLYQAGSSAEEIARTYPPLTPAQVHDAVSYSYDHPAEMDRYRSDHRLRSVLRRHDLAWVDHRLIPRRRLTELALPPESIVYTWETLPPELDE